MSSHGFFLFGPVIGIAVLAAALVTACGSAPFGPVATDAADATVGGSATISDSATAGVAVASPTPVPLIVTSITSPVTPDSTAKLTAKTVQGATCQLVSNEPQDYSGSAPANGAVTADGSGLVSWEWHIASDPPIGAELLSLTCNGETVSAQIEIVLPGSQSASD